MSVLYQTLGYFLRGCFKVFYRYRVYGNSHVQAGAAILAPNHVSFLDPPLVGAGCPEEVHFLARASLFKPPFFSWLLPRLNAHPLHKNTQDIQSLRLICQLLSEGKKVVIFPEGIRSATGELQPIKTGIAMLAMRMQCPLIPVYLQGAFEAWPRHSRWPKFGARITCVFGKPIHPQQFSGTHKKQMQEALAQQVQQSLTNLQTWLTEGAQGEPP